MVAEDERPRVRPLERVDGSADGVEDAAGQQERRGAPAEIGDQLRVSGKKKDDLQAVIALLRAKDFGIALQFTNYR